jgi:hypothetical protein
MSTKKDIKNSLGKKGERRCEAAFFKDTSNYFSLLNLKSLIERFKYVKAEMNTICDTETFMSGVLNNLLCTYCLDNFMRNNQYYEDTKLSKTRDFKFY